MGTSTEAERTVEACWAAGELRGCLRAAQAASSRWPDAPVWPWWEARARYRLGDVRGAASALRRVLVLDPTRGEDWQRLAHAEAELGREAAAVRAWSEAARAAPGDLEASRLAARACYRVDHLEAALPFFAALDRAGALEAWDLEAYALSTWLLGQTAQSLTLYERLAASQPTPEGRARALLSVGEVLGQLGRYEAARGALRRAEAEGSGRLAAAAAGMRLELEAERAGLEEVSSLEVLSALDVAAARLSRPEEAAPEEALRWLRLHNRRGLGEAASLAALTGSSLAARWTEEASGGLGLWELWAQLLWLRQLASLTPWRLYAGASAGLVMTDKLTEWLQGVERDDLRGLVEQLDGWLAGGFAARLGSLGDGSSARAAELLSAMALEPAGVEALVVLSAPGLSARHRRWLEAMGLPVRDVPLEVLATVVEPRRGHASSLRPALLRDRLGVFRWGEGEVEGERRAWLNAAGWWLDALTGVERCAWRAIDPRIRVVEASAAERSSGRRVAEGLRREGCAVVQTQGRRPSMELEALSGALGRLALVPASVGVFGASGGEVRRELARAGLLDGAVAVLEVPEEADASAVRAVVAGLERPSVLWAPELTVSQRAARALGVEALRLEQASGGWVEDAQGSRPFRLLRPEVKLESLVLGERPRQEVQELLQYVRLRGQLGGWGYGRSSTTGQAASALIHGPSGVGKSALARAVAGELGLPLLEVDVSKVLSRYIGEAEKRLASIFEEAEEGAVLVFEEADGLFMKRLRVKGSGERYANLQVNYLLQRLEDFGGVVLLITREPSALDDAFARRLRLRIELEAPTRSERRVLWERMVGRLPFSAPEGLERLAGVEATGAQIEAAVLMAGTYALEGGREGVGLDELKRGLAWVLRSEGFLVPASLRGVARR